MKVNAIHPVAEELAELEADELGQGTSSGTAQVSPGTEKAPVTIEDQSVSESDEDNEVVDAAEGENQEHVATSLSAVAEPERVERHPELPDPLIRRPCNYV
jgi:hypothetical protein